MDLSCGIAAVNLAQFGREPSAATLRRRVKYKGERLVGAFFATLVSANNLDVADELQSPMFFNEWIKSSY